MNKLILAMGFVLALGACGHNDIKPEDCVSQEVVYVNRAVAVYPDIEVSQFDVESTPVYDLTMEAANRPDVVVKASKVTIEILENEVEKLQNTLRALQHEKEQRDGEVIEETRRTGTITPATDE